MKKVILEHRDNYSRMKPEDAVKLLYQSEFGGGHMIDNPDRSLARIEKEYKEMSGFPPEARKTRWESIGGGLCRMYLSCLDDGLAAETLNRMFVHTAELTGGSVDGLEEKLTVLMECCEAGELPFSSAELAAYLNGYREAGYPAVSHSSQYREAYHPAYRVVEDCYAKYCEVFSEIDRKLGESRGRQVTVAIDGRCGSGKSTLGRILTEIYPCNVFHMDDYFLRPEQRTKERLGAAGGNVDYERFKTEILDHLGDEGGLEYRVYDCGRQRLTECRKAPYARLNIIEGAYSEHPYFGDIYDARFFLEIDEEEQTERIQRRNGAFLLERFKNQWIPMENRYFDVFRIKEKSICISVSL